MHWKGIAGKLRDLFQSREINDGFFQDLEDAMIEADMGVRIASETADHLRKAARDEGLRTREQLRAALKTRMKQFLKAQELPFARGVLNVYLVLGVNGVGKTTTIAKMAQHFRVHRGVSRILLVAGDTFRAAAIDQLKLLGERLGLPVIAQDHGADPGAVIFDGIASARARGDELLIADTAGRLHNKEALVKELAKIDKIVAARIGNGTYQKILVLDATTGQNSLAQAEVFHKAVGIDSIVLSKCDSTAKGGMAASVCRELGIPISFLGRGEQLDDLEVFDPDQYLDSLFGTS